MIVMRWEEAYEKASFFHSEQNLSRYWDTLAQSDGGGLAGAEHIDLIRNYMIDNKFLGRDSHVLDIGCGGGDYVVAFAEKCGHVTAMDYSPRMLEVCKKRCEDDGIENVSYRLADFSELNKDKFSMDESGMDELKTDEKYDCVMA